MCLVLAGHMLSFVLYVIFWVTWYRLHPMSLLAAGICYLVLVLVLVVVVVIVIAVVAVSLLHF